MRLLRIIWKKTLRSDNNMQLSDLPKHIQAQVYAQIQPKSEKQNDDNSEQARIPTKLDIKPSKHEENLNKTERAYLDELRSNSDCLAIHIQAITLVLGYDCRYTPDFITIDRNGACKAHEVKGFWRDDARVKIKVAARTYRWISFVAIQKKKSEWYYEEISG